MSRVLTDSLQSLEEEKEQGEEMKRIEQVARICHEANKAYCESIGDSSQRDWDMSQDWQRQSAIDGVVFALNHPNAPASAQHDAWFDQKHRDGWCYGPMKDPSKKEHPCMVPYDQLPQDQKVKDYLFRGIVCAFQEAYKRQPEEINA